jgi:hypothetical protein
LRHNHTYAAEVAGQNGVVAGDGKPVAPRSTGYQEAA